MIKQKSKYNQLSSILLLILLLVATALRLYHLSTFPPSPFIDEYNLAQAALRDWQHQPVIAWNGFSWYGTPELFIRALALTLSLMNFSSTGFRLIWSGVGWLLLLIIYKLAKSMFDTKHALVTLAFLSLSIFHLNFSRWAHGSVIMTTTVWLSLLFYYLGLKKRHFYFIVLAAISFALGLYSYVGMRVYLFYPLSLGLIHLYWWWRQRDGRNSNHALFDLRANCLFWLVIMILWLPQIIAAMHDPLGFWGRARELSIVNFSQGWQFNLRQLLKSSRIQFSIFFQGVDPNLRHNPLRYPTFPPTTLALALIGLLGLIKTKRWREISLILSLMLAAVLAGLLSGWQISLFRSQPILPAIYLLAATGFWQIFIFIKNKFWQKDQFDSIKLILLLSSLICFSFFLPLKRVFAYIRLTQSSVTLGNAFSTFEYQVAQTAKQAANSYPHVYLSADYYWYASTQYEIQRAQLDNKVAKFSLDELKKQIKSPAVLILSPDYRSLLPYFKSIWPHLVLVNQPMNILLIRIDQKQLPSPTENHQFGLRRVCSGLDQKKRFGTDATPYLIWSDNRPIAAPQFNCSWQGVIHLKSTGQYYFRLFADDWAELTLKQQQRKVLQLKSDDRLVTRAVPLKAGDYNLKLDYKNWGGAKRIELKMMGPRDNDFKLISPFSLRPQFTKSITSNKSAKHSKQKKRSTNQWH